MSNSPWTRGSRSPLFQPLVWLSLIVVSLLAPAGIEAAAQTTTNFAIGTTAQLTSVKRLGINIGGQNYYDSGQMLRNLIFRNPGFEGETWQSSLNCVAVTATSCTDANTWNVWPANFLAGATFQVISGAAAGETGTIISDTGSDYAAGNTSNPSYGLTFNFSPLSTPLDANCWVIIRIASIPGNAQAGWWSSLSGGATLSTDTTDIAPDSPGKQALMMSAASSGQSATVNQAFDTYTGRSFVQLKGTYTLTFKAKGLGGNNSLNLWVGRLANNVGNEVFLNQNVALTNQWQDYSFSFTANEDGTYVGPVEVEFTASGASMYLDDVALTEAAAANNPTAYRNAVVNTLQALHPGVLRYMVGTDFGASTDDVIAVPFARQRAGINSQATEQDDIPAGLEEFLVLCQTVGAEPWYTMAGEATLQDMRNLIEFLGGSSSTPYGAKRAALGQSEPWTSVFPKIHIELGNEMWNGSMTGENIDDPVVYGNYAATIFAAARASASYNPSSFDLIMGSQESNPWWTQQEMLNSSGYDSVDVAPYLFDTLSDYSSNEAIFGPMFAQPEQTDEPSSPSGNSMAQQAAQAKTGPVNLEVYEVNLGTESGTAPQNVVNQIVGSVGAGITVADHMLLMMRDLGITTQNMFALPEYLNGFTCTGSPCANNETMPLWGSVIDMGGETNLARPTFLAEQLANSAIMPTMLAVTVTGANPTWNQPLSANDSVNPIQLANAHYLQSFAFTDGTHYSVIVMNLSRSGSLPVTFSGANAPTGNVLISQLTSLNPTDNNENLTSNTPVVSTTQTNVSNFNSATPYSLPPFSMTVFQWPGAALPASSTMLSASPTSGSTGQQITLAATVSSQSGSNTPTGTVSFVDGATTLGTAQLDSSGVATFNTTTLPAGPDSITANYGGDSADAGSASSEVTVNIASSTVSTTTALTASSAAIDTGQSVTFTAAVAPQSGTTVPSGTVTFLSGSSMLGSATLNASGKATFSTSALTAGADSITASYGGSGNDAGSVSSALTVNVTQTVVATATILAASAVQTTPGQNVIFTATVAPSSGSTAPTGTVTFLNGTVPLGTQALNGSGVASLSTTALPAGADSVTASYGGGSGNSKSVSTAVTVTVTQSATATTTALASSAAAISTGQSVIFTAKVASQTGSAIPTGVVAFLNGSTILGTATINSSGVATFSTTSLPAGSDSITASYGGSTANASSVSAAVAVTVTQAVTATTTSLTASATEVNSGQSVTFTAKVTPQPGSTTPSGTVTFMDGATSLGTSTLNASGTASFSTASLAAGSQSIRASYGGSNGDSGSVSTAIAVTVTQTQVATTTALKASTTAINTGQNVTFTAEVAQQARSAVPAGTVTFLDGSSIIGTATLNARGVATFSTASLAAGAQPIAASYQGDSSNSSSTSAIVVVTVTQTLAPTATTLTASATQIDSGNNVVLTASVTQQAGSAVPQGTVTFSSGSTVVGTGTLNGHGTASFATTALAVGSDAITASYNGSAGDSKSTSPAVTVTVSQNVVATTTRLAASTATPVYGQDVSFTATVAPRSGTAIPTGMATFLDGGNILATVPLNASGTAVLNTESLGFGAHSITASYGGSASDSSSFSAAIGIQVATNQGQGNPAAGPAQTTTTVTGSLAQLAFGQDVAFTVRVASANSITPTGTVTLLDGSATLGSAVLSGGSASFSTANLPQGTNLVTAVYGGDALHLDSVSSVLTLIVTAPAPPLTAATAMVPTAVSLIPSATEVTAGQPLSLSANITSQSGSGMPAGTVTFIDGQTPLGTGTLSSAGNATFSTTQLAAGVHSVTASYGGSATDAPSVSAAITVTVNPSGTPGYTMVVSTSDVTVSKGQVANLTVTLTPVYGFNMPVDLACSGMPAGTTCSFSPATVTPNGAPAVSTLSILVASPNTTAQNRAPGTSGGSLAFGLAMPWGLVSLLGLSKRKNRSRVATWSVRFVVTAALIAGSLWMSGCGYSTNASVFTMTLTAAGKNVPTQTSQVTVSVAP